MVQMFEKNYMRIRYWLRATMRLNQNLYPLPPHFTLGWLYSEEDNRLTLSYKRFCLFSFALGKFLVELFEYHWIQFYQFFFLLLSLICPNKQFYKPNHKWDFCGGQHETSLGIQSVLHSFYFIHFIVYCYDLKKILAPLLNNSCSAPLCLLDFIAKTIGINVNWR